jgi:hypothetical protein
LTLRLHAGLDVEANVVIDVHHVGIHVGSQVFRRRREYWVVDS